MTTTIKPKIVSIIQARTSSKRFHNKVFLDLKGNPLIWHVVERLKSSKLVNKIVLATTNNPSDLKLVNWSIQNKLDFFTGSENNLICLLYTSDAADE